MTLIDCGAEQVKIDDAIEAGYRLGMAREELSFHLSNHMLGSVMYEALVGDYINALTDFHFGPGSRPHFASMDEVVSMVHNEIQLITRTQANNGPYIAEKLRGYCQDERAQWLMANDLPVMSRSVIHTMLDLIDDNRPLPVEPTTRS